MFKHIVKSEATSFEYKQSMPVWSGYTFADISPGYNYIELLET